MTATDAKPIFVLGADDPEMARIKTVVGLARKLGLVSGYIQGWSKGSPVHPGNAYAVDQCPGLPGDVPLVLVECGFAESAPKECHERVIQRVDHHNPGDPGFDCAPEAFWEGSSIGQVVNWINSDLAEPQAMGPLFAEAVAPHMRDLYLAAAADHCLKAAYEECCPGISSEEIETWRVQTRAKHQNQPEETVRMRIREARATIMQALHNPEQVVEIAGGPIVRLPGTINELPEASMQLGVPVEYRMEDARSKRIKVGLIGGEPAQIEEWMDRFARDYGLEDVYGAPVRGFAGGYQPMKKED